MATILLADDDIAARTAWSPALSGDGHTVRAVTSGVGALRDVVSWDPDLVVLGLGLPDMDGGTVLRMLRSSKDVPVIIATARDDEQTVVRLLRLGADDCLVKPFSDKYLAARVTAILRRTCRATRPAETLRIGDLAINTADRSVHNGPAALNLTPREFDLLTYLAQRHGAVVSRRELIKEVWRQPWGTGDQTLDVHVSCLRRKLGETAARPRYLRTVRGVGLKLVEPERHAC